MLVGLQKFPADRTAPKVNEESVSISEFQLESGANTWSVTISWRTDEPATSQLEYDKENLLTDNHGYFTGIQNERDSATGNYILTTDHYVTLTGLIPDQRYAFQIYSMDAQGNTNAFRVDTKDGTRARKLPLFRPPPLDPNNVGRPWIDLRQVDIVDLTQTSATVKWITDRPARGQLELCDEDKTNCRMMTDLATEYTYRHSADIDRLEPGVTYYIRVWAYNELNLRSVVSTYMTTHDEPLDPGDTLAPAAPGGLRLVVN